MAWSRYLDMQMFAEALDLLKRTFFYQARKFGENHPETEATAERINLVRVHGG